MQVLRGGEARSRLCAKPAGPAAAIVQSMLVASQQALLCSQQARVSGWPVSEGVENARLDGSEVLRSPSEARQPVRGVQGLRRDGATGAGPRRRGKHRARACRAAPCDKMQVAASAGGHK